MGMIKQASVTAEGPQGEFELHLDSNHSLIGMSRKAGLTGK